MKKESKALAVPALTVHISDVNWPYMNLLVITDTGKEFEKSSIYDVAQSQFDVVVLNAFHENLRDAIDLGKAKGKPLHERWKK